VRSEEDPELKAEAQVLQQAMPFAAMGAEGLVEKNGTQVCNYVLRAGCWTVGADGPGFGVVRYACPGLRR
jgi:hypothetical protein